MKKVKVTLVTFSDYVSAHMDSVDAVFGLVDTFSGGKLSKRIKEIKKEQTIWIDTEKVSSVGELTKIEETGDVVFRVSFDSSSPKMQNIFIKGDDYEKFMRVWIGEVEYLKGGKYIVDRDASVSIDGCEIKVTLPKVRAVLC